MRSTTTGRCRSAGDRQLAWFVGKARFHTAHLVEDVPDLGAVAVDRRDQNVGRGVTPELHDEFGQVGLDRGAGAIQALVRGFFGGFAG